MKYIPPARNPALVSKASRKIRVAIIGSTSIFNPTAIENFVAALPDDTVVVSGAAPGVDSLAESAAARHGLETLIFHADWKKLGRSAGPLRNEQIVDNADRVVAFWNGKSRGTLNSLVMAYLANLPIEIFGEKGERIPLQSAIDLATQLGVFESVRADRANWYEQTTKGLPSGIATSPIRDKKRLYRRRTDRWTSAMSKGIDRRLTLNRAEIATLLSLPLEESSWRKLDKKMVPTIDQALEEIGSALREAWALLRNADSLPSQNSLRQWLIDLERSPAELIARLEKADPYLRDVLSDYYPEVAFFPEQSHLHPVQARGSSGA